MPQTSPWQPYGGVQEGAGLSTEGQLVVQQEDFGEGAGSETGGEDCCVAG